MATGMFGLFFLGKECMEEILLDGMVTQKMDLQLELSKALPKIKRPLIIFFIFDFLEVLNGTSFDWGGIIEKIVLYKPNGEVS